MVRMDNHPGVVYETLLQPQEPPISPQARFDYDKTSVHGTAGAALASLAMPSTASGVNAVPIPWSSGLTEKGYARLHASETAERSAMDHPQSRGRRPTKPSIRRALGTRNGRLALFLVSLAIIIIGVGVGVGVYKHKQALAAENASSSASDSDGSGAYCSPSSCETDDDCGGSGFCSQGFEVDGQQCGRTCQ